MVGQIQASSASLLIPKACIERQTPKGPIFIPLVPVDQLPYQVQGIPLQISHRQIIKEAWQLLDETTDESPTTLQTLSPLPETPKYRAPDHDVVKTEAKQKFRRSTTLDGQTATCTSASVQASGVAAGHRNNEVRNTNNPGKFSNQAEALSNDKRSPVMIESRNPDQSDLFVTPVTTYSNDRNSLASQHVGENHLVRQEVDHAHVVPRPGQIVTMDDTTTGSSTEHSVASRPSSSDLENDRTTRSFCREDKPIVTGSRSTFTSSARPKIYCTYWIKNGECMWGEGCKFKHEMPESLFHLREVTQNGLKSYPQWWKDQTAIKARSPTWMETQVRAQKDKTSALEDATRAMAPIQVPDPSTWRSMRQQSGSVVNQEHDKSTVSVGGPSAASPTTRDPAVVSQASAILEDPDIIMPSVSSIASTRRKTFSPTVLRRLSQLSLSSNDSEFTEQVKKRSKVSRQPEVTQQDIAPPIKKTGLAASRFAPKERENYVDQDSRSYREIKCASEPELLTGFHKPIFERPEVPQRNLLSN